MKSWFLSDIHLRNVHERNGNTLLRFLFYLNLNPREHRLFFLGDIFDMWISNGRAFSNHYNLIVSEISKFKNGGGEVYYFEGNHDFHVDVFWTSKLKIPVIENMQYFDLEGLRVRLEHGDFINPEDRVYLKYRSFVRHALIEPFAHYLPSHIWKWVGEKHSLKGRKRTSHYASENSDKIKNLIHQYAEKSYNEKKFDLIVTGHMHIFDDYQFEIKNHQIRSINLGTWLEQPRVLKLENKKIEIIDLYQFLNQIP